MGSNELGDKIWMYAHSTGKQFKFNQDRFSLNLLHNEQKMIV